MITVRMVDSQKRGHRPLTQSLCACEKKIN